MATYYVSKSGSDSNNGLGPDASHASNKPWLTIAKALGASGIASGDTVYVGPGTYRETVTVAMTSATVETFVLADPANARAFKDGSGVLLAPGDVVWTGYTTNDTTTPPSTAMLNLSGRDFLTFENFRMIAANDRCISSTASTDITIRNCSLMGSSLGNSLMELFGTANVAWNWLIERCTLAYTTTAALDFYCPLHTADYNVNIVIANCLILLGGNCNGVRFNTTASGSGKPGGIIVKNTTILGGVYGFRSNSAASSTHTNKVYNCVLYGTQIGVHAQATGELIEDYCQFWCDTARSNVTAGGNSVATFARPVNFSLGYEHLIGKTPRPFFTPFDGSNHLGFGNDGTYTSSVDFMNRPRPSGGASTSKGIGYVERHDTAAQETSTVDAGSSGLKITGPGDHDIRIPVDASATVITIRARYDTTHDTTNKPQAILLANTKIGVTTETKTMTSAADTWETLTFASQTPSAKGVVTVRLVSRSAGGGGIAFFDTLTVA